ncbi:hypothetical protein Taro_012524 [Colocasia esculenta]|uniref:Uncharacterized protein n=1 Tax=Colocasia esculenta TaxID=4460 RepID=A0A843UD64_COLES|nr:hypothetical protein [Colocasia esculenta]
MKSGYIEEDLRQKRRRLRSWDEGDGLVSVGVAFEILVASVGLCASTDIPIDVPAAGRRRRNLKSYGFVN